MMELLEEMQVELRATQYWMKYLYLANATGEAITSKDIDELLLDRGARAASFKAEEIGPPQ